MKAPSVLFLLLAVSLAGCFGGDGGGDAVEDACEDEQVLCDPEQYFGDHFCEKNDVRPRVYAPDTQGPDNAASPWRIGDFWEYSLDVDGEDLGKTKLAYYDLQDGGAHYMVGTPTREEALNHAAYSTNPVIGRVHRTLYSPHESGSHADMFFFPLCQGSSWTDTFFDTEFTFTATQTAVSLPGGTTDPLGFLIRGTANDGSTVRHTYSPLAKWFTAIHLKRADGATVDMELTDYGTGYKGDAFFLRGQKDEVVDLGSFRNSQTITVKRQEGGEGSYDTVGIAIDAQRSQGDGRFEVHVRSPDGQSVACVGFAGSGPTGATSCDDESVLLEVPFVAGDWSVELQYPVLGGTTVAGEVRLVSIYDRSGSV